MDSEGMSLPLIHTPRMFPWKDQRKGYCCLEAISNGYFCKSCDFFVLKKYSDLPPDSIQHSLHPIHTLQLRSNPIILNICDVCGKHIVDLFYRCDECDFNIDLFCATYPPPEVIDISETHHHKLTLLKERIKKFVCDAKCGKIGSDGLLYKCHECDLAFHMDCVWHRSEVNKHPLEVNHSHHSLHPLKLFSGGIPDYSDGKCRLCGRKIDDRLFYHCSSCNFTLDLRCVLNPPQRSLLNLKAHDHLLTLLPRLDYFTCNACGLKGDRSPYICVQCDFKIHEDCLDLPRLININRHDHRVARTSLLGILNSKCGVCHQKVDWTCGGYSCVRCIGYVAHSKCATRSDVWNGKELEGVPEEVEDIAPYVVIDDNTIQHFSHKEHYLRLHVNGVLYEENKRCRACTRPISLQDFYSCIDCDFNLHKYCAEFPTKKWHVLHNERLTLVTSKTNSFVCHACDRRSNGFRYKHGYKEFDVLCGSISDPFVHPSHPHHPLYFNEAVKGKVCNGCDRWELGLLLRCIEDGCEFFVCFKCANLPQVVKHRVEDQPLSLCYGEKACGICWCDICESKTNPKKWFYTCKDHRASLHTECVLGDLFGFMPGSTINHFRHHISSVELELSYEVVLNNSISRPFCWRCVSHCMYPIMLKIDGMSDSYFCSVRCIRIPRSHSLY